MASRLSTQFQSVPELWLVKMSTHGGDPAGADSEALSLSCLACHLEHSVGTSASLCQGHRETSRVCTAAVLLSWAFILSSSLSRAPLGVSHIMASCD